MGGGAKHSYRTVRAWRSIGAPDSTAAATDTPGSLPSMTRLGMGEKVLRSRSKSGSWRCWKGCATRFCSRLPRCSPVGAAVLPRLRSPRLSLRSRRRVLRVHLRWRPWSRAHRWLCCRLARLEEGFVQSWGGQPMRSAWSRLTFGELTLLLWGLSLELVDRGGCCSIAGFVGQDLPYISAALQAGTIIAAPQHSTSTTASHLTYQPASVRR